MPIQLFQSTHPVTVGIYTALAALDVSCAWRFVELYDEPVGGEVGHHLRYANQFWRDQLCYRRMVDTRLIRSHLIDRIELGDYLRMFAQQVAPSIVRLDLPQRHMPVDLTYDIAASAL